ncbi:hypothetical protein [Burkholderia cepacia]|uniref:hypothetical protein n=1 Tax=Burkholderia cepacia TaxID=292 RepID=UPI0026542C94|nr:hypothetical protein [Burkholderia cepacia]MDN7909074.1 hypothetical protein [Burkholderia cepacia]
MRNIKTTALGTAFFVTASLPLICLGEQTAEDKLRTDVITAVAQALGADPGNLPDYATELRAARRTADVATFCGPNPQAQFLTPQVADKVTARAITLLKQKNSSLWERPQFVRDLIVVSAASFEAGRIAGTTKEYRAGLAASAPAGANCNVAAR